MCKMAPTRTLKARVVDPIDGQRGARVVFKGAQIVSVVPAELDADSPYLFPGFVDLHVYDWSATEAAGVTSYLATCGTRPTDEIDAFLEAPPSGSGCLGVHLEGPFLNQEAAGAQPAEHVQPVDPELLERWLATGSVRVMTIAPEVEGGLDAIRAITEAGVVASIGHTRANYYTTMAAVESGARFATHLWNAMSGFTARTPGAVGTLLADDRVTLGIIADGRHLHPVTEKLTIELAGAARIAITSDLVPPPHERPEDGKLLGGDRLGTALVQRLASFGLDRVARMASLTPAQVLGLEDRGRVAPGFRADLALLDAELAPLETIVAGTTVWQA
jgi:N-acetylglucosamine-6-phosphate deacetylase